MFALIEEVHKYLHGGKLSPDMLMVESDVMKLEEYANKITGLIHDKDDVEAWVISKIAKAEQTIANVKHTLEVTYPKRFAHGGEVIKHDGEIIHMMLHHIGKYATKMLVAIRSGKIHIDEWMKHELAIAGSDIDSVYHYLDTFHKQKKEAGGNMDMEEDYFEADEYADGGAVVYVPNHATPSQRKKIAKVMHEFKHRQLKSHDHVVTDIKQAMAIAMSEAGLSYEKHAKSDTEYSFGGDLLNKAKHIAHAGYNKAHELVSKHIHKEHHKAKKYELGDMWSEDFDYDGLLEAASKIGASMRLSDVEMIFRSMEDVNYHRLAKLLDTYIKARKKTDNHKKRADSLNYFRKMLKKFNEEYKKGGKVIEAGRWVVYNPETNEIIKNVGSHVTAKKEMYKLWDTEKYNELGIMSYRRWSQENVFCEGGGVGHYEDGGGIISSFRLPASDTTPVGLGGIPNYNTPLDEWALHYDKGGSLYKSPSEYKEELEVKSDEEIARLYSEEFGLNIDDVLEDIEDERDEYIRELVHDYKTGLKSKGEI
jgi:hypothetical protein